jgi:Kae1-associated kinase Bud32
VNNETILYKGAEAEIIVSKYLGFDVILKKRITKGYRLKKINDILISTRTREEVKLMNEARKSSVCVPIIYDVDLQNGIITMSYVKGQRVKDFFNNISEDERKKLCFKIGENIGSLHKNDIIHGDITTSNMILLDDMIYFIDFGLGEINSEIEAKGVDLHVLMEAIESTHSKYSNCFEYVLEGYRKIYGENSKKIFIKIDEIIKRGRYK